MDAAAKGSGGNGSVTKKVGLRVKALIGSNNEGSFLARDRGETKEKIGKLRQFLPQKIQKVTGRLKCPFCNLYNGSIIIKED